MRAWLIEVSALVAVSLLLCQGGCAGMVAEHAVEKPEVNVQAPVEVKPQAVSNLVSEEAAKAFGETVGKLVDVSARLEAALVKMGDTTAGRASTSGAQSPAVTETETIAPKQSSIGLNNQFVFNVLTGTTGGVVTVLALWLLLSARKRVPARTARRVASLLSKAIAAAGPRGAAVRKQIEDLLDPLDMSEAEVQVIRRDAGTSSIPGTPPK